jgi:predicted metal-binding membrane protein
MNNSVSAPIVDPAPTTSALVSTAAWWRDRGTLFTGAALLLTAALAWIGVVWEARRMEEVAAMMAMPGMGGMASPTSGSGMVAVSPMGAVMFVASWGVMMAAMMLPSAAPMIALYRTVSRSLSRPGQQTVPTSIFAATYLVVWALFGVPVYLGSVAIDSLVVNVPAAGRSLAYALALILIAAGAYQFTALKRVCLKQCQTPLMFLMARWRSGYGATVRLGLAHAAYCVGCCWALMVVLVAAGAMSLPWVLLIAVVVFVEKLLPRGEWVPRLIGGALVLLGVMVGLIPDLMPVLRGEQLLGESNSAMNTMTKVDMHSGMAPKL